jgi:hypothetical protein
MSSSGRTRLSSSSYRGSRVIPLAAALRLPESSSRCSGVSVERSMARSPSLRRRGRGGRSAIQPYCRLAGLLWPRPERLWQPSARPRRAHAPDRSRVLGSHRATRGDRRPQPCPRQAAGRRPPVLARQSSDRRCHVEQRPPFRALDRLLRPSDRRASAFRRPSTSETAGETSRARCFGGPVRQSAAPFKDRQVRARAAPAGARLSRAADPGRRPCFLKPFLSIASFAAWRDAGDGVVPLPRAVAAQVGVESWSDAGWDTWVDSSSLGSTSGSRSLSRMSRIGRS